MQTTASRGSREVVTPITRAIARHIGSRHPNGLTAAQFYACTSQYAQSDDGDAGTARLSIFLALPPELQGELLSVAGDRRGVVRPQQLVYLLDDRGHSPRGSEDRGWTARCPAHEDNRASLSIGAGDDGRVLVHCHAGCTTEAIAAALGLTVADLFDRDRDPAGQPRITETYDYINAGGELLYQVVRFDPKDFRQRRPDGAGGWVWKLGDTRRVLYRLPKVLEAVKTGQRIWVVEGERDVHALEAVGEVATCNPGGAGKWRPEFTEVLSGATVTVVSDRDEPGRKHANAVATSLDGIAAEVKVVEPAKGKDARDHLAAGLAVADFVVPCSFARGTASGRCADDRGPARCSTDS